jgi:hypothetical protein
MLQKQAGSLVISTDPTEKKHHPLFGGILDDQTNAKVKAFGPTGQLVQGDRASAFRVQAHPRVSHARG